MFWNFFKKKPKKKKPGSLPEKSAEYVERMRARGVRVGKDCLILSEHFGPEPYLLELGDRVGVSVGVSFVTHDGSAMMLRGKRPGLQHFGRIVVGSGSFIGKGCLLLPGTFIGENCILGAGTVVRGVIPDNSLVVGNPGRVVGRASLVLERMDSSPNSFDSLQMTREERRVLLEKHFGLDGTGAQEKERAQPK